MVAKATEQLARADEFKLDSDLFSGQITLRALNDMPSMSQNTDDTYCVELPSR